MHSWPAPKVPLIDCEQIPERVSAFDARSLKIKNVGPETGTAKLYVCGITPYDATHLGHAFTYLTFDTMNRAWRDAGLDVKYVQNITDVDDPLLERADATGQDWLELATDQIQLFSTDMEALRVLPPDHLVPVSETMNEVEEMILKLKEKGLVYQLDDEYPDWYFRCSKVPGFGKISHLNRAQMLPEFAEHGGDPERPGKEHPLDALVWRLERPGEPSWESSLGKGRPGWHIECTAIALNRLGANLCVQGGGSDLIFPHHEMCNAQSLAVSGEDFAHDFVYAGMVGLDGEKMSKSKGNLELVSRLRARGEDPMAIRLALLNHHYQSDWEWFASDMEAANRRADAWKAAFCAGKGTAAKPVIQELRKAVRNNLDTPKAIRVIDEWTSAVLAGDGEDTQAPGKVADAVDALLGVRWD